MKVINKVGSQMSRLFNDAIGRPQEWNEVNEVLISDPEEGSTTVEYAIGVVAAAGFAGVLMVILKSGAIKSALQGIIESALAL